MIRARALAAAALVTALGCAHAPPQERSGPAAASGGPPAAAPAPAADRVAALRAQVDARLAAQGRALWDAWTRGGSPELDLDGDGSAAAALYAPETLAFLAQARDAARGDERRALALLHAYVLGEQLARALGAVPAPAPTISWDGHRLPAARAPSALAAEPDRVRRAALERAWAEAERRGARRAEARWTALAGAAQKLGYGSLLALAAELRGEPIEALAALADGVLTATDATYRALLDALGRVEMGQGLGELHGRDLPRLFRAGEEGRMFPAERLAADAAAALDGVGLGLSGPPAVAIDAEARPGKDPRALTVPIDVPSDVRVSFAPSAGASELRGLLHELGAAAFYAHVRSPVMEFRRLGSVTPEAWGHLVEALSGEPGWLAERTGLDAGHLAPLVRAAAARRLHRARTLAARILCEVARAREPGRARELGRAIVARALARPVEADELDLFLADRDPLLESADALRAVLLAAEAEQHLAARAGADWWRSQEAGAVLAAAFADGSRLAPAALARALGAEALDGRALAAVTAARASAAGLRLADADER